MGCFSGMLRIFLLILNIILLIAFAGLAAFGLLIRFDQPYLMGLLNKALEKWPVQFLNDLITLVQNFGSPVSIACIVIGFFVVIVAIIGIFALLCKVKCLAIIYLVCISVLSIAELGLIIYLYAIPDNLYKVVDKLMNETLRIYGKSTDLGQASMHLWAMIGSGYGPFCCGMTGYKDFNDIPPDVSLPLSCCNMNASEPTSANKKCLLNYSTLKKDMPGCQQKIHKYIDNHKTLFIAIPCGLFAFQVLVLIIMAALCSRWHRDD